MSRIARNQVGDFEIVVLKDGDLEFDNEVFPNLEESRINELLAKVGKSVIQTNFHAVLVRSPNSCILIDAGAREFFGPGGGQFPEAMKEAGFSPEEVQKLVVTHLHPDHIGGMTHKADNSAIFPNAEFILTEKEHNFWTNDANFVNAPEQKVEWRGIASNVLDCYKDRIKIVASDAEIAPSVSFIDLPGHTAGHAGVRVESNGNQFIHTADILHAPDLQLSDPNISAVFDTNTEQAVKSRKQILDIIATDRILFTGTHFLNCQLGYLEKHQNGYRLVD